MEFALSFILVILFFVTTNETTSFNLKRFFHGTGSCVATGDHRFERMIITNIVINNREDREYSGHLNILYIFGAKVHSASCTSSSRHGRVET